MNKIWIRLTNWEGGITVQIPEKFTFLQTFPTQIIHLPQILSFLGVIKEQQSTFNSTAHDKDGDYNSNK